MPAEASGAARGGRLPTEPYPGLRPFLDFEEILLFGRERQVRELIERLRETQFVAVIGGSGSGKSSLVLAGVMPELRSFGIPGAGDFWVPMVCTPGTNASVDDQQKRLNTPITRLARKFAALLKPCETPEQEAARLADIAERLREERGFAKLVRQYSESLATPPGPDPQEARFLLVIDQFEELFHPTTRHVEDARLLVERVIDHFFSPHPRCYVVLTMRSEHLNDCAGYLELPDAINKASYLVRRLDEADLGSAITGPAERLLRLYHRAEDEAARLPESVQFDPDVVKRLLKDVQAIVADPDHLPLLQHALARVWQAAVLRVADRLDFPDRILPADLAVAASALPSDRAPPPAADVNVLRVSLENWAESCYQRHSDEGRHVLDALLRRLAVKDPNTGMYSQQRLNIDDGVRLLGPGKTRDDLKALLRVGFLGEVDYLYWDDDNPQRVTLKVSHESFIRGWARLRGAIDDEAERYAEFVELLRKCDDWKRQGRSEELLLEAADLRRMRDATLGGVLANGDERDAWFRRLKATPAFAHLAGTQDGVDQFLRASEARQQALLDREGRRQRNRRVMWVAGLLFVPPLLYWTVVQGPVFSRLSLLVLAGNLASATARSSEPGVGTEAPALRTLVDAAALVDRGRQGSDTPMQTLNRFVLDNLSSWPVVGKRAELVEEVAAVAEPVVNGNLRDLLEQSVWSMEWPRPLPEGSVIDKAGVKNDVECTVPRPGGGTHQVRGKLFTAVNRLNPKLSRSVFVPDQPEGDGASDEVELLAAKVALGPPASGAASAPGPDCEAAQRVMNIPRFLKPDIAFDANLRFLMFVNNEREAARSTTLLEIDWERTDDEGTRSVKKLERVVLRAGVDATRLTQVARAGAGSASGPGLLDAMRTTAGRAFLVDGAGWRIFDQFAQRVRPEDEKDLRPLQLAGQGSACDRLDKMLEVQRQPGFEVHTYVDPKDPKHCFVTRQGRPPEPGPDPGAARMEHVVVGVYPTPSQGAIAANALPAPIASLPRFMRVNAKEKVTWAIGSPGSAQGGWIAAQSLDSGNKLRYVAAPWSTCALWKIGTGVLQAQSNEALRTARDEKNRHVCQRD